MFDARQLYHYDRMFKNALKYLEQSGIPTDDKEEIRKFATEIFANGRSESRVVKYVSNLVQISKWLKVPLKQITKSEVVEVVRKIESLDYADSTKRDFKVSMKYFVKWLRGFENPGEYPKEVSWIRTSFGVREKHDWVIPTYEDFVKLLKAATHPRDKALLWITFEVGPRPSELLSPQIKDVKFDEFGAVMHCTGKTGFTRYRLVPSARYLAIWLEHHPFADNPDAPLWVKLANENKPIPLAPWSFRKILMTLSEKAGVDKRIYPYLFRHRDATVKSDWMNEFQLKEQKNWSPGSKMAAVYIHRSGKNLDNTILRKFGLEPKEEPQPEYELPMCVRCMERSPPTARFCFRCGFPIDTKFLASQEKKS